VPGEEVGHAGELGRRLVHEPRDPLGEVEEPAALGGDGEEGLVGHGEPSTSGAREPSLDEWYSGTAGKPAGSRRERRRW